MHAERCPVCQGRGTVPPSNYNYYWYEVTCHACGGYGWVEVNDIGEAKDLTTYKAPITTA